MAAPEILLTDEQRLEFTQIPENISEWEIARYYTFTDFDKEIINRHRRDYNRLGFAVQLAVLRYPGWTLNFVGDIPSVVLNYISVQINVNTDELALYAQRENTRFEHLQEIREEFEFRNYTDTEAKAIADEKIISIINENLNREQKFRMSY